MEEIRRGVGGEGRGEGDKINSKLMKMFSNKRSRKMRGGGDTEEKKERWI